MNLDVRTLTYEEFLERIDYSVSWEPPVATSNRALSPRRIGEEPWKDLDIRKTLYFPQLAKFKCGLCAYPELRYLTINQIKALKGKVKTSGITINDTGHKTTLYAYDDVLWSSDNVPYKEQILSKATNIPIFSKKIIVFEGEIRPSYVPIENIIYIPAEKYCQSRSVYLECYFHESIHWTKDNISNCHRDLPANIEEIVACLGQIDLLGKTNTPVTDKRYKMMLRYIKSYMPYWYGKRDFNCIKTLALKASDALLRGLHHK